MHRLPTISLLAVGLTLSPASLAAQDQPADDPAPAQAPAAPLLAGPQVEEARIPGVESSFSMMKGSRMAQAADRSVPGRVFQRALRSLAGEDVPEDVRLKPDQVEAIRAHVRDFESQRRAYRREHADELSRIRSAIGDRSRDGRGARDGGAPGLRRQRPDAALADVSERPDNGDRAQTLSDDERQALIARARQLRRSAPQAIEVQTRVWAELTDAQRAHLERLFEAWHAEQAEKMTRRDQERYAREIAQRMAEREADQAADQSELRRWFASLPDETQRRVRQRLSAMPEERRRALVERVGSLPADRREAILERLATPRSGGERAGTPRPPR